MIEGLSNSFQVYFQSALSAGSPVIYVIVFLAGFLASLTPCVYPMIPVMVGAFYKYADGDAKKGFFLSLMYTGTFTCIYVILGMIAALSGTLLGRLAGSAWLNFAAAISIVILSLSMFGLYEIKLPALKLKGGGFLYMVLLGSISGVVFSACAVPVLGAILLFVAHTRNVVYGASLLLFFSLGMSVLFLVSGFLGGKIKFKSGVHVKISKYILGFMVLLSSFYFFYRFITFL